MAEAGLVDRIAKGRADGDAWLALERLLVDPDFLLRVIKDPAVRNPTRGAAFQVKSAPAQTAKAYKLSDIDVASRLSFFLWNASPDDALLMAAEKGDLHSDRGLAKQVDRMLETAFFDAFEINDRKIHIRTMQRSARITRGNEQFIQQAALC